MPLWAFTLFLSSLISTIAINRLWRSKTKPLAFGSAFAIFCIVFASLEGDTSNGTDDLNMAIVYVSLLTLPFAMFLLTRWTAHNHREIPPPKDGG